MAFVDPQISSSIVLEGYGAAGLQTDWPIFLVDGGDSNELSENPAPVGPYFKTGGTGKRYIVTQWWKSAFGNYRIYIISSTDGLSWSEEAIGTDIDGELLWTEFSPTVGAAGTIYVGYKEGLSGATGNLAIRAFDLNAGTWSAAITGGPSLAAKTGLWYLYYPRIGMFTRLSNGHIIAAYQKIVSDKPKTKYQIYNGTSWSADVDIDPYGDASTAHTFPIGINHDANDVTYFFIATPTGSWYGTQEVFVRSLGANESTLGTLYRIYPNIKDLLYPSRTPFGPSLLVDGIIAIPLDTQHTNVLTGFPPAPEGIPVLAFAAVSADPVWKILQASVTQRTDSSTNAPLGRGGSVAKAGTSFMLAWPERMVPDATGGLGAIVISRCEGVDVGGQFGSLRRVYRQEGKFGQSSSGVVGEAQDRIGVLMNVAKPSSKVIYWEGPVSDIPPLLTPCPPSTPAVGALYDIR